MNHWNDLPPNPMHDEVIKKWEKFKTEQEALGQCPYSGLTIKECKSWLCDCFEFEAEYGVSQK